MKYDKLSWSQMVRDAEEKKQGLFEYLRDRAAAQMECTPEQVMEKMSAMLTVMEEAVDFGLTGVRSNSGLTGGSAKKMREMLEERQKGEQPTLLGPVASDAVVFSLATAECNAAISIVFKNMLGLVCDPVAGLVEVPCIKRNAGSVMQALLAAEMSLADIGSFIPADEAIDAMKLVGNCMPSSLRETAGGGMAATPTAREWARNYFAAGKKKD